MSLSQRAQSISLSVTLALDARAKALADAGRDIVNMSVGEPDFPAPAIVQQAASRRVLSGDVRYTPAAGARALRKAIGEHAAAVRGIAPYAVEEVTVCHSTKHALSGAVLALVDPGDEVLLILPAWVSYVEIVRIGGGVPVSVPSRADCGPDFDAIERAITPRTKAVLYNSPSNPTGYVWTHDEVRALASLCERHGLWILSDEIYRRLVYDGEPNLSPATLSPALRERTIVLDGASKSLAMTGYRIGFAAGPREVTSAIERLHSHLTGAPNTISQDGYLAALSGPEPVEIEHMCAEFDRRRRWLIDALRDMGLSAPWPRGAFYAFPDVRAYLDERGTRGLCEDVLEQVDLALVPGTAFGVDTHVRLSYALSLERIQLAAERLRRFLERHPRRATALAVAQRA
ncbi:MAG: pyridoxal phosphate-dependent aminotransferase [Planctomycetes bacterium]|nr:pyridoxal phosphate-dependent aminotransferase [Planctomycetota bacterium]